MQMTLFQINVTANSGSTGRIAEQIGETAQRNGWNSVIAYGRYANLGTSEHVKICNKQTIYYNVLIARLFDCDGLIAKHSTLQLIKKIQEVRPDIIHLHNIHGYYVNYPMLFSFLKEYKVPIVWTLHDCWSFTGHCSHFDLIGCDKWKTECSHCPQKGEYPKSYTDFSRRNFRLKKKSFTNCENLTIVPVSYWLDSLVKESFLKEYNTRVIHNGIDVNVFSVKDDVLKIREKYNITSKYIVLGVASPFGKRKGFSDFLTLSEILSDEYCIVMVGLSHEQKTCLPNNIVGIERTQDVNELASLYSSADVFVNLTYEDNFPTTNLEAMACGTPVITYNTGGSPEALDAATGIVVEKGNIWEAKNAISAICSKGKAEYVNACRKRAVQFFNNKDRFMEYIGLYNELLAK